MHTRSSEKNSVSLSSRIISVVLTAILAVTSVFALAPSSHAASYGMFPGVSSSRYIKGYTVKTSGNIKVYKNASCTSSNSGEYISAGSDECYIIGVDSRYNSLYVSYPTSKGRKSRYVPASVFSGMSGAASGTPVTMTAKSSCKTYKRSTGSASYGSVSKGDTVYVLETSGSRTRIVYPVSGGWKIAWADNTSLFPFTPGTYTITSKLKSNMVVDISGGSRSDQANVQLYESNGTGAQKFNISHAGNGWYKIQNVNSGKVIDVSGGNKASGTNVWQYAWNGSDAQLWQLIWNGNSYYLRNKLGCYLDVSGGYSSNGTNIWVYSFNGTNAQRFTFNSTSSNNGGGSDNSSDTKTNAITVKGVALDYALGDYFTDDGKECSSCHGGHGGNYATNENYCNCKCTAVINGKTVKLGAIQCFGFARYVQSKVYGYNSYANSSKFTKISGSNVSVSSMSASRVKSLITSAGAGAHIRTKSSAHSMIVTQVTSTGFTVIQANGSNNANYSGHDACRIGQSTYTWSSYVSSTYGKRGIEYIEVFRG